MLNDDDRARYRAALGMLRSDATLLAGPLDDGDRLVMRRIVPASGISKFAAALLRIDPEPYVVESPLFDARLEPPAEPAGALLRRKLTARRAEALRREWEAEGPREGRDDQDTAEGGATC